MSEHPHPYAPGPYVAAAPPKKKRTGLKIALAILGVSVLGCCGLGIVAALGWRVVDGTEEPMAAHERELLLTVEDLSPYVVGGLVGGPRSMETAEKRRFPGGGTELFYEYDAVDDRDGVYLSSGINFDRSVSDANMTYTGMNIGASLGLSMAEENIVERDAPELLQWGDESKSTLLVSGGVPVGNVFVARKGRRVFHLILAGVYFDDPAVFQELVLPHLDAMDRHRP